MTMAKIILEFKENVNSFFYGSINGYLILRSE